MFKRVLIIGFLVVFILSCPTIKAVEQGEVLTINYAPYAFYETYEYQGEGNEFAGHRVTLDYPIDEEGVYQYTLANAGVTITYIYQITDEGIYELSYFPDAINGADYRYHPDTLDAYRSLKMPLKINLSDSFMSGYDQSQEHVFVEMLPKFELEGSVYRDVMKFSLKQEDEAISYFMYYAPNIGLIFSEFIIQGEEDYVITETLASVGLKVDYSGKDYQKVFNKE